ncbi:MAG TPA: EthD family reductase [Gemmatimonadaceae bacterium]|nr:EthD family reductase [Gemmatimonadaceae bacterium]
MFKLMFFLYRRPDLDADAFRKYSAETHVPIVARIPGLQRYVINHTVANPSGAPACDAVAELWFESAASFEQALTTPEATAALNDQANYLDMNRTHMLIVDEKSIV